MRMRIKAIVTGSTGRINNCSIFLSAWLEKMAGKLLLLCFVLAMVAITTCKPRNPFGGLFRRGKLVKAETDKSFGYFEHVLFEE